MARARKLPGRTAFRLNWQGDKVLQHATDIAIRMQGDLMYRAAIDARARLYPGHGVDTGTMKKRTHVAKPGNDWNGEHVEPHVGAPGIPNRWLLPTKLRNNYALELGCGQNYTIYYHQKKDAFLRIPFEDAMADFLRLVEYAWKSAFD